MMMELRRGQPDDISFVYRLEKRYMEEIEPEHLPKWIVGLERLLDQWVASLPRMTVAHRQGVRLGYMFWDIHGDKAVLASIAVDPSHRRGGIGSALLKSFEDDARSAGCSVAELGFESNNPARHLYEKFGYHTKEATGRYVLMTKALRR
jgi:ribosomal protein S18 acetylase RimI-like enzyme